MPSRRTRGKAVPSKRAHAAPQGGGDGEAAGQHAKRPRPTIEEVRPVPLDALDMEQRGLYGEENMRMDVDVHVDVEADAEANGGAWDFPSGPLPGVEIGSLPYAAADEAANSFSTVDSGTIAVLDSPRTAPAEGSFGSDGGSFRLDASELLVSGASWSHEDMYRESCERDRVFMHAVHRIQANYRRRRALRLRRAVERLYRSAGEEETDELREARAAAERARQQMVVGMVEEARHVREEATVAADYAPRRTLKSLMLGSFAVGSVFAMSLALSLRVRASAAALWPLTVAALVSAGIDRFGAEALLVSVLAASASTVALWVALFAGGAPEFAAAQASALAAALAGASYWWRRAAWRSEGLEEREGIRAARVLDADLLEELRTGDIILYAGRDPVCRTISFFTGSRYSHVAMIVRAPPASVLREYGIGKGKKKRMKLHRKNERKNTGAANTRRKFLSDVFVVESNFGSEGESVNLQDLESWLHDYYKADGAATTVIVRPLLFADRKRDGVADWKAAIDDKERFPPLVHLLKALHHAKYTLSLRTLLQSCVRMNERANFKQLFCSEMVAACYHYMGILDYAVPQNDVVPGDFGPPKGRVSHSIDIERHLRLGATFGEPYRLIFEDDQIPEVKPGDPFRAVKYFMCLVLSISPDIMEPGSPSASDADRERVAAARKQAEERLPSWLVAFLCSRPAASAAQKDEGDAQDAAGEQHGTDQGSAGTDAVAADGAGGTGGTGGAGGADGVDADAADTAPAAVAAPAKSAETAGGGGGEPADEGNR